MEYTLRCVFEGSNNKKLTLSFPSADGTAQATEVKTLMQIIITGGEVYMEPPLTIVGAEFVGRSVTPIDVIS